MVAYEACRHRQVLRVVLEGRVTMQDLQQVIGQVEEALQRMRPGYLLVADSSRLTGYELEAAGVVLYLARRVMAAKPSLMLFVNGGRTVSATVRKFVDDIAPPGTVRYFDTAEEMDAFLGEHVTLEAHEG